MDEGIAPANLFAGAVIAEPVDDGSGLLWLEPAKRLEGLPGSLLLAAGVAMAAVAAAGFKRG